MKRRTSRKPGRTRKTGAKPADRKPRRPRKSGTGPPDRKPGRTRKPGAKPAARKPQRAKTGTETGGAEAAAHGTGRTLGETRPATNGSATGGTRLYQLGRGPIRKHPKGHRQGQDVPITAGYQ
jgi:hypothetical protein